MKEHTNIKHEGAELHREKAMGSRKRVSSKKHEQTKN